MSAEIIQALSGRTILITRPRDARDDLAAGLAANGARIEWCPTIEITEPESFAALDSAINDLFGYDWVIFTSANGVEYFGRRVETLGHSLAELDDVRVCAIGEATAGKLREVAVHVDLVPGEAKAEGVYRALCDYLGSAKELKTLNFLLPRAAVARDYLPRVLTEAGARVDDVACYRTVAPDSSDLGRIKALLDGGGIDCVTFTSSSTVRNFAALFDVTELAPLLVGASIACIGEVTAETAREFGLDVTIQPAETSLSALAKAISDHFAADR